ncbi:MAG: hypothetical protein D6703_00735 [Zetaproteobacteria bacterium]|nr:MAG: hypothetical protein D6703_00735 [Zetaproteobacteria bacterium]
MHVLDWQVLPAPQERRATTFDYVHQYASAAKHRLELTESGFAIRFEGRIHVYRNQCPHAGSPLDWQPGQFFDEDGQQLVCHTHGARFHPATGAYLSGPSCPHGLARLPFTLDGDLLRVPARIAGVQ